MGRSLHALRYEKGLPVDTAAKQIGVAVQTLLDAESGRTQPNITTKVRIAEFYGVKHTDIWPYEAEQAA